MRCGAAAVLLPLLVCAPAGTAAAQSGFAGAGIGLTAFRFPHQVSQQPNQFDNDISGDTRSWSATAGLRVGRHGVVQVEYVPASELTRSIEPTVFTPPCPSCGQTTTTVDFRSRQLGILGGYSTGLARRVSISALGGLVLASQRVHTLSVFTSPPGSTFRPPPSESTATQYVIGPHFGLDAVIALSRQLRIVPLVRINRVAAGLSGSGPAQTLTTTAGVEGRWYF